MSDVPMGAAYETLGLQRDAERIAALQARLEASERVRRQLAEALNTERERARKAKREVVKDTYWDGYWQGSLETLAILSAALDQGGDGT